tara:strand:- start:1246 stop:3504 length:2259 start_codon:yes stop_codon:yes gene_type:complete
MSLADLRLQIEAGTVPSPGSASILAFLDLTRAALGSQAFHDPGVLVSEQAFSAAFPVVPEEALATEFGDAALYGRCRDSIRRHARLAGAWPDDPYTLLNQLARDNGLLSINRKVLQEVLPGIRLRDLTREMALVADRDLRGTKRNTFRTSLATMDKLRDDPRIQATEFLGRENIGPLPIYRDGSKPRFELPATLAEVTGQIPVGHALHARRAYELAVDFGLFGEDGPWPGWSITIADATHYHLAASKQVSASTADLYLRSLLSLLRNANPALVPKDVTADRVRHPKRYETPATPKARKSDKQLASLPDQLENEVFTYATERSQSRKKTQTLRRVLRHLTKGGIALDDRIMLDDAMSIVREQCPHILDSTLRNYGSTLRCFLRHTERLPPWDMLISGAKDMGMNGEDLKALSRLARQAERADPAIQPEDIDIKAARRLLLQARQDGTAGKTRAGLRLLDGLRGSLPSLLPDAVTDSVTMERELPDRLVSDLSAHATATGYSAQGVRARIVAARALYRLSPDKSLFAGTIECIRWLELIKSALAIHPKELAVYRAELLRLADQIGTPWPLGWKALQSTIVQAGIPRADNPIDVLMEVAMTNDLQPWQLDREWAWVHERSLRPDLRRKWTRAVANFDALRTLPGLDECGLLPALPLGPMPRVGARLKNAHFPLPRSFESALEGENKQVLEAAHFLWRCLRAFGDHSRGEDPLIATLVADETLERIIQKQTFMSAQSAQVHVARIRDWRKSRPVVI